MDYKNDLYGPLVDKASIGVDRLLDSNDIAIIALTTCLVFSLIFNAVQYFCANRRQDKDFDRFLSVTVAIAGLEGAVDEMKAIFSFIQDQKKGD